MLDEYTRDVILYIDQLRKSGLNSNELENIIRKKSVELGLTYQELYNLLVNKEYLLEQVNASTCDIDDKIKKLFDEIGELKIYKSQLSSIVCELYGHDFTNYKGTNIQTCKICGKQEFIRSDSRKLVLNKKYKR